MAVVVIRCPRAIISQTHLRSRFQSMALKYAGYETNVSEKRQKYSLIL